MPKSTKLTGGTVNSCDESVPAYSPSSVSFRRSSRIASGLARYLESSCAISVAPGTSWSVCPTGAAAARTSTLVWSSFSGTSSYLGMGSAMPAGARNPASSMLCVARTPIVGRSEVSPVDGSRATSTRSLTPGRRIWK